MASHFVLFRSFFQIFFQSAATISSIASSNGQKKGAKAFVQVSGFKL